MTSAIPTTRRALLTAAAVTSLLPKTAVAKARNGRERLSLNEGWRFHAGDPEGLNGALDYDVRPEIKKSEDGKEADARPVDATQVSATRPVLKPWILPTANPFISDPNKRHVRPAGHPGAQVSWVQSAFDDSHWKAVTLPHDWAIAGPFLQTGPYGGMGRLKTWGPAWYRREVHVPASDKGRCLFLDIDGAMSYATVWCNEGLVGGWPYGYNSFRLDLTPHLTYGGANHIVIRLDNPPESARWYPGAGLYRNVWLVKTDRVHVAHWGTQITTPRVSQNEATVDIVTRVDNDGTEPADITLVTRLYALDAKGKPSGRAVSETPRQSVHVAAASSTVVKASVTVLQPRLWGPPPAQVPNRYVAVTRLMQGTREIDRYETPFGIRSLRFDADKGLFINDRFVPLQGVNNHHDLGALGAAFNVRAAERQLEMLMDMGCNALRMSHNPPAPELLDLCDRMGIVVLDEVFDCWEKRKTPLDFHLIFPDWHEADLRAMLRRDRNHPSIVIWSVGNEVGEQYSGEAGAQIARRLVTILCEEDTTRPVTNAMNWAQADMPLPAEMDVISLNYQGAGIRSLPSKFPAFRAQFPNKIIFQSESSAAVSSRGEYQFPVPGTNSGPVRPGVGGDPKTRQVSAYELFAADFGSSPDRNWAAQDQNPYVAGEFVWTGWDYLGEPTPYYEARSSYFGIIDLAGFKKDRFWLYQARWRPDLPVAYLLPHWNWARDTGNGREGEVTPVHLFTNGDEAELFVNGKSQGRIKKRPFEYRLRWDYVIYEPGEIRAVVYKDGKPWAEARRQTTGAARALTLEADRSVIEADGKDLSFVTLRIVDDTGETVPFAKETVTFTLEGPGEIVATDNGDPTDFTAFPSPTRKAFNGLALAIVRAKPGQKGRLTLRAESAGLIAADLRIATG